MSIRIGEMRHRVSIQKQTKSRDGFGDPKDVWREVVSRRSSVEPLVGREFFAAQERGAKVTTKLRMRYVAGVVPSMRIVWDNRWFDIVSAQQVKGKKHELLIIADERVEVPVTAPP